MNHFNILILNNFKVYAFHIRILIIRSLPPPEGAGVDAKVVVGAIVDALVVVVIGVVVVSADPVGAGVGEAPVSTVLIVFMMGFAPSPHLLVKSSMDKSHTIVPASPLSIAYCA